MSREQTETERLADAVMSTARGRQLRPNVVVKEVLQRHGIDSPADEKAILTELATRAKKTRAKKKVKNTREDPLAFTQDKAINAPARIEAWKRQFPDN